MSAVSSPPGVSPEAFRPDPCRPTCAADTRKRSRQTAWAAPRQDGSDVTTGNTPAPVAELLDRSHRLGADKRNTNFAGGNTSAKGVVNDPVTGAPTEVVWVKGS